MRSFIKAHLDPVDRLGEVVFSLIMALGFIGACRLELAEAENRAMLIGVFGCNLAWAIVDGVMFACAALFERGLRARLIRRIVNSRTEDDALKHVAAEFDDRLVDLTAPEERRRIYLQMIELARRSNARAATIRREDIFGGIAAALVVVIATVPVVLPFAVMSNPLYALRTASAVALILLFLSGCWWGKKVGVSAWRTGTTLTIFGVVLVIITIALGG